MERKAAERIGVMGLVMDLMHVAIEERHGVQHAMRPKEMGLGEQRGELGLAVVQEEVVRELDRGCFRAGARN